MGREFVDLFDRWAESYDDTVHGVDEEYKEVFLNYNTILQAVADSARGHVIEFGVGTGNLTSVLKAKGLRVTGVEPSGKMRDIAREKHPDVTIHEGDFLSHPAVERGADTYVSTYAFHHLTDEEKKEAANLYFRTLNRGGKVVFADTMFTDDTAKQRMIRRAENHQFYNLAEDLRTEYYTTIPVLSDIFREAGFEVEFTNLNPYVWLMSAVKKHDN
ncbi:class I SAM-dependent DNA methyltransferase [Alteribacter natronophilus]|uniref:class I SAM-dependent DNA methyltransferase n=1 Tax=Alteribacter natronophilus TaxID=2583810 RepID=UPI00110F3032|nr:class I SAM-dependent methyltransferase [Alteribacter natronophilus]TMW72987.1 methyltransferase domain-containing protein [Alteribacter natronophilus]